MNKKNRRFLNIVLIVWVGLILLCLTRMAHCETGWSGSFDTGLTVVDGHSDELKTLNNLELIKTSKGSELSTVVEYDYNESAGVKIDERIYIEQSFEQDLFLSHKSLTSKTRADGLYYSIIASLEKDYAEKLERKITVGPSLGFATRSKTAEFTIDAGPLYTIEKYDNEQVTDYVEGRARQKFSIQLTEEIQFKEKVTTKAPIDDLDDFKIIGEAEVKTNIIKSVYLKLKGKYKYDNIIKAEQHHETIGIVSLGFGF